MKNPKQMPDWWPEIGYRWGESMEPCVEPFLMLLHPNHRPVIWHKNRAGEWDFMRVLEI